MTVTIDQQIACLRREIAMRKNVYPKWVANGRLKQPAATAEIEAMQAAHDSLMAIKEGRLVPAPGAASS